MVSQLLESFLSLLYPPSCMHCRGIVEKNKDLFCSTCQSLLELLDPKERCRICFCLSQNIICKICQRYSNPFDGCAAAFEYQGPAATMIRKLKYEDQPYLSKGLAAYMAGQFLRLKWPMPDVIIPMPITFMRLFQRGYNQSLLLAKELSHFLGRPIEEALSRKSGDFSQAGLTKKQRLQLSGECFKLKKGCQLQDKNVLLIDDVMTTGSTLKHCGKILLAECPRKLYALTVCRAEE